jgi:hypothetical protein
MNLAAAASTRGCKAVDPDAVTVPDKSSAGAVSSEEPLFDVSSLPDALLSDVDASLLGAAVLPLHAESTTKDSISITDTNNIDHLFLEFFIMI